MSGLPPPDYTTNEARLLPPCCWPGWHCQHLSAHSARMQAAFSSLPPPLTAAARRRRPPAWLSPPPLQAGERVIAASRRPDGTVRKERRVRAGYVPQDEQAVYVSRGAAVSRLQLFLQRLPPAQVAQAPRPLVLVFMIFVSRHQLLQGTVLVCQPAPPALCLPLQPAVSQTGIALHPPARFLPDEAKRAQVPRLRGERRWGAAGAASSSRLTAQALWSAMKGGAFAAAQLPGFPPHLACPGYCPP